MLQELVYFAPDFAPTSCSLDYEEAAMNAFRSVFYGIELRGCYFHLMQNFWDKIAKRGLKQVNIFLLTNFNKLNLAICSGFPFRRPCKDDSVYCISTT
jgi:hypothetical protein